MDKHNDIGILLPQQNLVKYCQEVISVGGEQTNKLFNSVYEEISEAFGYELSLIAKKYVYSEKTIRRMLKI